MLNIELSWQQAAIVSGCLYAGAAAARIAAGRGGRPRLRGAGTAGAEAGTLLGLFALWQFAGSFSVMSPAGAIARARWIWHAERLVHLPSEAAMQRLILPFPLLAQACNLYYATLHFTVLLVCLLWLFVRHRQHYRPVRDTVAGFTAVSLLIQFIPVAPPRMLASDHMVDTGVRYGQSVYGHVAGFNPDQLSAMPSVHVGWAIIVALAVIRATRGRWRWLALGYPAVTTFVVIVTANHFWFDAIAAALLLAVVLAGQHAGQAASGAVRAAWAARIARTAPAARAAPAGPGPWWPDVAMAVSPAADCQVISAPRLRDGGAAGAPAAAAGGAEARQEAPSWHSPPPEPPVRQLPRSVAKWSGSR